MLLRVGRAFGGWRLDEIVKVILPSALPLMLAGLRLGAGRVLVGIVVGEMFSANAGLGFRLSFYGARLRAPDTLAPLLGVVAIGIVARRCGSSSAGWPAAGPRDRPGGAPPGRRSASRQDWAVSRGAPAAAPPMTR